MSYQQTSSTARNDYLPVKMAMFNSQQASRGVGSASTLPISNENNAMDHVASQFSGLGIANCPPGANMSAQVPMTGHMFYTADGQLVYAPGPIYSSAPAHLGDSTYNSYQAALPYLTQAAYHGYLPGYSAAMQPYTPGKNSYLDRADFLSKDVPGLDNRRGSYSTNESAPGTPIYGTISQHGGGHIAVLDRSPFGSTPSPQQYTTQPVTGMVKSLPFKKIPVDVDIDALVKQHPAIPVAVPAVFTPQERIRTLDQSLANPITGNRNVYIRGLHPDTDDETLAAYATRFGLIETSKAIIDNQTGACKGYVGRRCAVIV